MSSDTSRTGDDPSASSETPSAGRRIALILCLAVLGLAAYAASLVATFPARTAARQVELPEQIVDVSGTLWNGQAILAGGYEMQWKVAPLRSLLHLALDVEWTLRGADTSLSGQAALRPDVVTLADVEGRAGWGLVRAAAPDLTVNCDGTAEVALSRVVVSEAIQGAVGEVKSSSAVCSDSARTPPEPIAVPALTAVSSIDGEASRVLLTASDDPAAPMAEFSVANRVLTATIHPKGAELTKVLPTSGPTTLEFPF